MAKTHLFHAVCTVAILAAVPALAQRPEAGMTNPNGTPNPMAQQPADNTNATTNSGADNTGTSNPPPRAHRSAMTHAGTRSRADAQDDAVNQLNDESLHAARQGQNFSAAGSPSGSNLAPSGTMPPGGTPPSAMPQSATPGSATPPTGTNPPSANTR